MKYKLTDVLLLILTLKSFKRVNVVKISHRKGHELCELVALSEQLLKMIHMVYANGTSIKTLNRVRYFEKFTRIADLLTVCISSEAICPFYFYDLY